MEESMTLNVGIELIDKKKKRKNVQPSLAKVKLHSFKPLKENKDEDSDYEDEVYFSKLQNYSGTETTNLSEPHVNQVSKQNKVLDFKASDFKQITPVEEVVFSSEYFKDVSHIHPYMVQNLEQNFEVTQMTTVQKLSLPVLLSGKDALIRSQTGSGKTLAYALPIIESLQKIRPKISRSDGIKALVILPTRELALQSYECFLKLVKSFAWLVPGMLVGGEKRKSEKARLRKGINILVGTPGRLIDHAQHTKSLVLDSVQWLILDEADMLLDMGYEKDVASILSILEDQRSKSFDSSTRHQTVLLSATMTAQVEKLAGLALVSPVAINASSSNEDELVVPKSLVQSFVILPPKQRLVTLAIFIIQKLQKRYKKMLVFMATQAMVDYHIELFSTVLKTITSTKFMKLHGNMEQHERTEVFKSFRQAEIGVLMCTDVAARGLDLPSVDWIVQYTGPATPADYVHRVGRTARINNEGFSVLFLLDSESQFVTKLRQKRIKLTEVDHSELIENWRSLLSGDKNSKLKSWANNGEELMEGVQKLQEEFETAVVEQKGLHALATQAYTSWVRFYATYPRESREVYNFKHLHLGHHAKCFALQDPPSTIGKERHQGFKNNSAKSFEKPAPPKRRATQSAVVGEFESGLKPMKKKKKTEPAKVVNKQKSFRIKK
uniref:ATP-dependent RNA helicase n=1 Tax=Clastoptera arizonana TaxID=38151 RepID=A0A1B6DU77_9HEMI